MQFSRAFQQVEPVIDHATLLILLMFLIKKNGYQFDFGLHIKKLKINGMRFT